MPWGIHRLKDMIGPPGCSTPHGRAVPEPYGGRRLLKAWWVLTGRAEAVIWPEPGDLEAAFAGCTCHPDDNPPRPCARRYALNECRQNTP